jgi:putative ABC transport system permease protein
MVKQYGLDSGSKIVVYFPQQQNPANGGYLVVRTSSDPAELGNAIVREVHTVDPGVPVYDIRTMQERLSDSLARQRFAAAMLGAFAAFALLLAAIGVYGVISYLVTQSTHDIGVRVALGAQPAQILSLVVRQGMALAAVGIAAGLIGAVALTRVMTGLLFGVSATDALTFASVAAILAAVVCAATIVPARRATGVDPMVALREE